MGDGGAQTGLGGVRDATNVVPPASLAVAVLASIGMEHQAALGGTLNTIVAAKAGIAKSGCPVRGEKPGGIQGFALMWGGGV